VADLAKNAFAAGGVPGDRATTQGRAGKGRRGAAQDGRQEEVQGGVIDSPLRCLMS